MSSYIRSPCHLVTLSFVLDGTFWDIPGHDPRPASQNPRFVPAYSLVKQPAAGRHGAEPRRRAPARRNKSIAHYPRTPFSAAQISLIFQPFSTALGRAWR